MNILFNTEPMVYFMEQINTVCNDITKLNENTLDSLITISNNALTITNMEDKAVSDLKHKYHNVLNGVMTRSMTRKAQAHDEQQAVKRVDYIHPDVDNIDKRLKLRSEVLFEMFGYRGIQNIFDLNVIKAYQDSDNTIQTVKLLMAKQDNNEALPKDLRDKLLRDEPGYLSDIIGEHLTLDDDGLLWARTWDDLEQEYTQCVVVPFVLRGKFMDYAHHNPQMQHFHHQQTLDNLQHKWYWPDMKKDIKWHCEACTLCKFVKGSIRHRAPMQIRDLPKPRQHLMCDFLGPIHKNYYILVMIDYATGWTMLVPTTKADKSNIIDAIINKWIPLFGVPSIIETDYGNGFNSTLYQTIMNLLGLKVEYADVRNHRGIGKVERIIGFIQSILLRYNVQLNDVLVEPSDPNKAWKVIKAILPHIQMAINQRRPRFTTYSPNMLMFGMQLNDITDVHRILRDLNTLKHTRDITRDDYQYLTDLISKLTKIHDKFKNDWKNYQYLSKQQYNHRYKTHQRKIQHYNNVFKVGTQVLYFVGDKWTKQKKWRRKWSGPWTIQTKLSDSTVIIVDSETGNQKRVTMDRLKVFSKQKLRDYIKHTNYYKNNDEYNEYQSKLKDILYKHDVETFPQFINLDYRVKHKRKHTKQNIQNNDSNL